MSLRLCIQCNPPDRGHDIEVFSAPRTTYWGGGPLRRAQGGSRFCNVLAIMYTVLLYVIVCYCCFGVLWRAMYWHNTVKCEIHEEWIDSPIAWKCKRSKAAEAPIADGSTNQIRKLPDIYVSHQWELTQTPEHTLSYVGECNSIASLHGSRLKNQVNGSCPESWNQLVNDCQGMARECVCGKNVTVWSSSSCKNRQLLRTLSKDCHRHMKHTWKVYEINALENYMKFHDFPIFVKCAGVGLQPTTTAPNTSHM